MGEITSLQQSCQEGLGKGCQCDLVEDELAKVAATISDEAKKLPRTRVRGLVSRSCHEVVSVGELEICVEYIHELIGWS